MYFKQSESTKKKTQRAIQKKNTENSKYSDNPLIGTYDRSTYNLECHLNLIIQNEDKYRQRPILNILVSTSSQLTPL